MWREPIRASAIETFHCKPRPGWLWVAQCQERPSRVLCVQVLRSGIPAGWSRQRKRGTWTRPFDWFPQARPL